MTTETKKYAVSFPLRPKRAFYELAKKHIVKGKRGGSRNLSKQVDKVAYGI